MHPWGGVYWLSRNLDYNENGIDDLDLEMGDECKEGGLGCEVPRSVALKIDEKIDDGDLETGNVRYENVGSSPGYRDFRKLLFYDTN